MPSSIKNLIALTNSPSEETSSAQYPTVVFSQEGISGLLFDDIKNDIILTVVFVFPYWALTINFPSENFLFNSMPWENVPSVSTEVFWVTR